MRNTERMTQMSVLYVTRIPERSEYSKNNGQRNERKLSLTGEKDGSI